MLRSRGGDKFRYFKCSVIVSSLSRLVPDQGRDDTMLGTNARQLFAWPLRNVPFGASIVAWKESDRC